MCKQSGVTQSYPFSDIKEHAIRGEDTTLVLLDNIKPEIDFNSPNDEALEFFLVKYEYYQKLYRREITTEILSEARKHYNNSNNERLRLWYDIAIIYTDDVNLLDYESKVRFIRNRALELGLHESKVAADIFYSRIYRKKSLRDSMYFYLGEALNYSNEHNLYFKQGRILRTQAKYLLGERKLEEALIKLNISERIFTDNNSILDLAQLQTEKADIYFRIGYYEKALEILNESYEIYKNSESNYWIAKIKNSIGLIHILLEDWEEAIKQFQIALEFTSVNTYPFLEARIKSYIGQAYLEIGNKEQSKIYLTESIALKEQIDDAYTLPASHCMLADLYYSNDSISMAEKEYKKAIKVADRDHTDNSKVAAYYGLSQIAAAKKNYSQAKAYALKSLKYSDRRGSIESKFKTLLSLAEISTELKEYKKGADYYLASINLQDTVMSLRRTRKIASIIEENKNQYRDIELLNLKYQNNQKESIIEENQLRSRSYLLYILFAMVVSLLLAYNYRQHKKASTSQEELNTSLHRSNSKLLESNQKLEQFAHLASHDLKSPIRTITTFSSLLKKKSSSKLNENELDYIDFIVKSGKNLSEMIDDILAYSKLGSQKILLEKTDLNIVIKDLLSVLSNEAKEKGVTLIQKEIFPTVSADMVKIKRVFLNIISNAIKFSDKKKDNKFIHLHYQKLSGFHQFSITDNGIGIGKTEKDLFTTFTYLNSKENYNGTGMGLAICKNIISKHGGKIWYESEYGKGTTFYFNIPESNNIKYK
ncbi:ATP-binding protein [Saprospiraceae bacterium]|nr:ATP-binding protein [Saprospiraceae bacterium]